MAEVREAARWYGERGLELDVAFLDEVASVLAEVRASPARYPKIDADLRKAPLRRFPYVILYRAEAEEIVVVACCHGRRDPQEWRKRL
jgi:plasmid stabilization system protein ParE